MKNIHILPTDKPSRLAIQLDCKPKYNIQLAKKENDWTKNWEKQNIYITNDEYIGLSYYLDGNLIRKGVIDDKDYWEVRKDYKKIILTTDQDLIKDGVQAIDDEFLEWFVKNPSCEEVEIIQMCRTCDAEGKEGDSYCQRSKECNRGWAGEKYKIIIPKEEPKQETLGYICPTTKKQCDDECCVSAKDCHLEASMGVLSEPKQETVEEAKIEYHFENDIEMFEFMNEMASTGKIPKKWSLFVSKINDLYRQQERMYSEEDMRKMYDFGSIGHFTENESLEQFKNK